MLEVLNPLYDSLFSGRNKHMTIKKIPLFEFENYACRKPKTMENNEFPGKRHR